MHCDVKLTSKAINRSNRGNCKEKAFWLEKKTEQLDGGKS